jgi:hypothetical protein
MNDSRFRRAVSGFDAVSAADPERTRTVDGDRPRELVQAERLEAWVLKLEPDAGEALRLAARCQHVGRYLVPRSTYPEGRIGYLRWRSDLAKAHAARASETLRSAGYDEDTIERVRSINMKLGIRLNADVQTMEDALCLSFLEHEYAEFSKKHDDRKLIEIIVKTWRKMSPRARELALTLPLSGRPAELVKRALAEAQTEAGEPE